jgi:MoaA/NifB/PqqE/SkfB family radical SAM enzyme
MLDGKKQTRACPMLRDSINLDPKGNVLPCVQAYERKFANIRDGASQAWRGSSARRIVQDMRRNQCPTCTAACGVSYTAVAAYAIRERLGRHKRGARVAGSAPERRPAAEARRAA